MANIKISDLTAASAAADANEFEINEAGTSKKVTGAQISALVETNLGLGALATLSAVGTTQITDGSVTNAKLGADAVDGTKIADDAIDSEHIAADSIDSEHYAPGSVDTTALADSSVTTAKVSATGTADANTFLSGAGTWAAAGGGGTYYMQVFNNPGTWSKPANVSSLKVSVVGGGGGYYWNTNGNAGGTSSFGAYCSATGGSSTNYTQNYRPGVGSGGTFNWYGVMNNNDGVKSIIGPHAKIFSIGNTRYSTGGNPAIYPAQGFGAGYGSQNYGTGAGGSAVEYLPAASVPGPVAVTVGNLGYGGGVPVNEPNIKYGTKGGVVVEWWE
jgi:hypothetical protein